MKKAFGDTVLASLDYRFDELVNEMNLSAPYQSETARRTFQDTERRKSQGPDKANANETVVCNQPSVKKTENYGNQYRCQHSEIIPKCLLNICLKITMDRTAIAFLT